MKGKKLKLIAVTFLLLFLSAGAAQAVNLAFDETLEVRPDWYWDADEDGLYDLYFSTTDPGGFFTSGSGVPQTFIDQPALEGSSRVEEPVSDAWSAALDHVDLRVDFLTTALDGLSFGFATDDLLPWFQFDPAAQAENWISFEVYNAAGDLIASDYQHLAIATLDGFGFPVGFAEGEVSVTFADIGAYALFDFHTSDLHIDAGGVDNRYIIDNFAGRYGSSDPGVDVLIYDPVNPIPEPATMLLLGSGLLGLAGFRRKFKK